MVYASYETLQKSASDPGTWARLLEGASKLGSRCMAQRPTHGTTRPVDRQPGNSDCCGAVSRPGSLSATSVPSLWNQRRSPENPWPQSPVRPGLPFPSCYTVIDLLKRSLDAAWIPSHLEPIGLYRSDGKRPEAWCLNCAMEGRKGPSLGCNLSSHPSQLL